MTTDRRRRGVVRLVVLAVSILLLGGALSAAEPRLARAAVPATLDFAGHGYGHGRGLGQWGAYGYATRYGWTYDRIVRQYYGGTTLGTQPDTPITVRLVAQDGLPLKVTSSIPFTAGGQTIAAGDAAQIDAQADGTFLLSTSHGCAQATGSPALVIDPRILPSAEPADPSQMLTLCTATGTKNYRGEFTTVYDNGGQRTVNRVRMEDYLRGVVPRESPASWGDAAGGAGIEALKAQAVAARSYAYSENRYSYAQTCDTTACQVYGGAGANGTSIEDSRSDAAVAATAGRVLRNSSGTIARAEFSSSTGGYTAGGTFPAVPDDGDIASPYHNWTTTVATADIAAAWGVGSFLDIEVTVRNGLGADDGRVTQVVITGTTKTVTTTGNDVRSRLGLKSDWFTIVPPPVTQPTIFLGGANASGTSATRVSFGDPGDIPLVCDWDGNGTDTPGVFRKGVFFLSQNVDGTGPITSFAFGDAGDQPLCGDWDGNGTDTVGVFRNGMVYLRNFNSAGPADGAFAFGAKGDRAVAGDWNDDGFDTLGVFRAGWFYLTNSNLRPTTAAVIPFGNATGDVPVVGDWNGDGTDRVAVKRGDTFYLNEPGGVVTVVFGEASDRPLAGDPDGDRVDTVAVGRAY